MNNTTLTLASSFLVSTFVRFLTEVASVRVPWFSLAFSLKSEKAK